MQAENRLFYKKSPLLQQAGDGREALVGNDMAAARPLSGQPIYL